MFQSTQENFVPEESNWYEHVPGENGQLARKIVRECDWSWTNSLSELLKQFVPQYQLFILCKIVADDYSLKPGNDRFLLSPSTEVDLVWHEHMLRPQSYFTMCRHLLFNEPGEVVIGHSPVSANDSDEIKALRRDFTNTTMNIVYPKWRDIFYVNLHLPTSEESSSESVSASLPKYLHPNCSTLLGTHGNWNHLGSESTTDVEAETFSITVNMPSGNSEQMTVLPRQSVKVINNLIKQREGIPITNQRLFFGRNRLITGSFEFYGIKKGDTIDCYKEQVGC
jgi:hypothetical protein